MNQIIDNDALLSRAETAAALRAEGYRVAAATLATKAVRGGGPPFMKFSRYAVYRWGDALTWAKASCSRSVTSTSELAAVEGRAA
jgi:hypothetical protein